MDDVPLSGAAFRDPASRDSKAPLSPRHRVLFDLWVAGNRGFPYAGIPQDCRLTFKSLANADGVALSGLIHPHYATSKLPALVRSAPDVAAAEIMAGFGSGGDERPRGLLKRLRKLILDNREQLAGFMVSTVSDGLLDAMWRQYLQRTLSYPDRGILGRTTLAVSAIPESRMVKTRPSSRPLLDTRGYDFAIFPHPRTVRVSAGTTKVVRFHDMLPVTAGDTFPDTNISGFADLLRTAAEDSFFVCNSEPSRGELLSFLPQLEARSAVIPCSLPDPGPADLLDVPLTRIVANRQASVRSSAARAVTDDQEFILMVSTLEPRKNHVAAIDAYYRVAARLNRDLRFVVVGKAGWGHQPILSAMRAGIRSGSILHLADLPFNELASLMRRARLLLFPSFAEGFGFTPLEAMLFGTPAVVSDIPTHRWVLGDAALYADPYDPEAMAVQAERLLGPSAEALRSDLMAKGNWVLQRYRSGTISDAWGSMLDRLAGRPGKAQRP